MKVADPACGSGAFLVQCYRRLIEQDGEFRPDAGMRPARLREILEQHIFGVDRDGDACRVAELSLQLALLDYVDPPDLESTPSFKLPKLHDRNIFQADFFKENTAWRETQGQQKFAWIVGNPPWIELKKGQVKPENRDVWKWMKGRSADCPTGGNQVAEAFAWLVAEYLDEDGLVGLLLPAMTLFKRRSAAGKRRPRVQAADKATKREFKAIRRKLRKEHSQWVYFDRNLRIYSGRRTYLFKPMQRLQWTRSQALLDAGAILAETLA